ncbi:MAG: hypothetical protein A2W93_01715 [Bacteroidetes bacterium GWF2_43_63]|nr:MAG: hypothetical protein A2W94_10360 [Bacteroidetes bacterium GWE2_42_42]OFY55784.1 MAG: hypothetical protein A2W93_01715 [Bacteroidetes bacterium GWF2_43_63]HBG71299.1 hypothetical protein [Bacteroidales bacterium]HCB60480.1 hypothetical protein [Bacteroidales bacterium]HCY22563.1 hypothetical protein [Bacteroidales bacterium]
MKTNSEKIIVWSLRIIVAVFFIISAFSKMLPAGIALDLFAKQIVDIGVTNWCYAPLLARAIVGFELFLGLALLQNNYLKKWIVPATFLLLLAFCIHLAITIFTTGNSGSCGCFGELIPMTPLEAIIKNVVAMAMLAYIFIKTKPKEKDLPLLPATLFVLIYVFILIFLPPKCCCASIPSSQEIVSDTLVTEVDTAIVVLDTITNEKGQIVVKTIPNFEEKATVQSGRKKVNSIFSKYTKFNSGTVDLNSGKKIVCLFSMDCEHCQESSKLLQQLKKSHADFPGVYILAFGEESQTADFFAGAGGRFPYTILPPQEFFQLLGKADYPPRIVVMDNGNFMDDFLNFEHLDTAAVMKAVKR